MLTDAFQIQGWNSYLPDPQSPGWSARWSWPLSRLLSRSLVGRSGGPGVDDLVEQVRELPVAMPRGERLAPVGAAIKPDSADGYSASAGVVVLVPILVRRACMQLGHDMTPPFRVGY